jgi:type VI secretion system protein VasG
VDVASVMLRGIKSKYEDHHDVQITDEAVAATAKLSDRYITGRQLPDKAVDLLDTASARVKMTQSSKPSALEDLEHRVHNLDTRIAALQRDHRAGLRATDDGLADLVDERERVLAALGAMQQRWETERTLALKVEAKRREIGAAADADGSAEGLAGLRGELQGILAELTEIQADAPLVHAEVNEHVVAQVISDWTGIPIGNMIKDEAALLLELEHRLQERIEGQDEALNQIADSIRSAKAGMGNPEAPIGVFLLVGPSGVGKTETARALAELLFGGERFLISINMSEYQEAHTVSQLKGSPPGYVGYGEGGVLTEAVRQRPYSVVLLDEVEKAHPDVMELFFQVFDRGMMRDGEGREIDFSNTVIMATSNVGSDAFLMACAAEELPTPDELRSLIHGDLVRAFQAALLARMRTVPFYPLARDAMARITRLKLAKIDRRLRDAHGIRFLFGEEVVERIAERCTQVDAGARNIDFIIDRTVLPEASRALLEQLASGEMPGALTLGMAEDGGFTYVFSDVATGDGAGTPEDAELSDAPLSDAIDPGLLEPPPAAGPAAAPEPSGPAA